MATAQTRPDRIDSDKWGLDDVVIYDIDHAHFEMMDKGQMWMRFTRIGKPDKVFWFTVKGKRLIGTEGDL